MKKGGFIGILLVVAVSVISLYGGVISAQGQVWQQSVACPGWNNPNNFMTGNSNYVYSARTGKRITQTPNVFSQLDGSDWGQGTTFTNVQMASAVGATNYTYGNEGHKDYDKLFVIIPSTYQVPGAPAGYDPNTGNRLPFVPTQYNTTDLGIYNTNLQRSIRIGDCCAGSTTPCTSTEALRYTMEVTPDNAMLYIYYSIVVQSPTHGTNGNPEFIIRVMRQNGNNWTQMSDTLAYYVSSTPSTNGGNDGLVVFESSFNSNGWHQNSTSSGGLVNYKDWTKVGINLSAHMREKVMIEVIMEDCNAQFHYGYAYICGECRPMKIESSGCPGGRSTYVTKLTAPRNMLSYKWYVSEWGVSDNTADLNSGGQNSHFTFRQVSTDSLSPDYYAQASDFRITRRGTAAAPQTCDSMGFWQTFRCDVKSALDPAKPFVTSIYTNVNNTKPTVDFVAEYLCDGTTIVENKSYVPGAATNLVIDSITTWTIYEQPNGIGSAVDTIVGSVAMFKFDTCHAVSRSFLISARTSDATCYTDSLVNITPLHQPKAKIGVSDRVLCDDDRTTLTNQSEDDQMPHLEWRFPNSDVVVLDSARLVRGFSNSVEPIELHVYNGLAHVNPYDRYDTIDYCVDTAYDTVRVFVHPELRVTGDTIVCSGSRTDALVEAVGVEDCRFEWSLVNGRITGGLPAGNRLQVEPYADTSVYHVRVTSPQGCVAWDSINAYLVVPHIHIFPPDGRICPGDTAIIYGTSASSYSWSASPSDSHLDSERRDTIFVSPSRTTRYTMTGHGSNNCDASPLSATVTIVPLPVSTVDISPSYVDSDDPTITLRDISPNSVRSSWLFNNSERVDAREITHTFEEALGRDSVTLTLTSYNALGCPKDYTFSVPVMLFTTWYPNLFTPGSEDDNAYFSLHTINEYENFHIYIYNRRGELLFESEDPHFRWDGTYKGERCPQGAYVYICNFRKPGTATLRTMHGSVTLIR